MKVPVVDELGTGVLIWWHQNHRWVATNFVPALEARLLRPVYLPHEKPPSQLGTNANVLPKLIVQRRKFAAVGTPVGVELEQHKLVVTYKVVVVPQVHLLDALHLSGRDVAVRTAPRMKRWYGNEKNNDERDNESQRKAREGARLSRRHGKE
ncbi:thioredoxin, putative [Leishmania tarentolae]|uniref:Thioredoxin, putative n=1 Tax=Leishmania tarentolae TaxID=5689 RepID=A0A640KI71_LEITA|nr:thioredoxin, putative [Leishmania tarentolae]